MVYKTLEVRLISGKDLKKVSLVGKMDVYVVASLSGLHPRTKKKTPVHHNGGSSPHWNEHTLEFTFNQTRALVDGWSLVFQLKHKCTALLGGDKVIGQVSIPMMDVVGNNQEEEEDYQNANYKVRTSSGEIRGEFEFEYKLFDALLHHPNPKAQASSTATCSNARKNIFREPLQLNRGLFL